MSKDKEEVYTLTPKGWLYYIKLCIEDHDISGAISACDKFEVWMDKHIVPCDAPKKKGKKK